MFKFGSNVLEEMRKEMQERRKGEPGPLQNGSSPSDKFHRQLPNSALKKDRAH